MSLMEKIFGDLNEKEVKKVSKIADKVMSYDEEFQKLTDGQLREIACEYMERMSALTDDGYGVGTPFKSSRIGKDIGYKAFKVLRDVERQTERTGSARPTATNSQRCHEPA